MELVIIGNGFDIQHGLNTRYSDFRKFLEKNHNEFLLEFEKEFSINHNSLWGNLEENIGNIDMLSEVGYTPEELGLETEDIDIKYTLDVTYLERYSYIENFPEYLLEWIKSVVQYEGINKNIIFSNETKFINFNYTEILEKIYGINEDRILHIHGSVSSEDLIFGHNMDETLYSLEGGLDEAHIQRIEHIEVLLPHLINYLEITKKNTEECSKKLESFLINIGNIDSIIVIGSSISNVDSNYFRTIDAKTNNNCRWIVYYYVGDNENVVDKEGKYREKLNKIGIDENRFELRKNSEFFNCFNNRNTLFDI